MKSCQKRTEASKEKLRKCRLGKQVVDRSLVVLPEISGARCIPLTKGKYAIVDLEDYHKVQQFLWIAHKDKNTMYARRALPRVGGKQRDEKMHHAIVGKPPSGMTVDHINGNGLDNRKCNLRIVTNRENCMNRHVPSSGSYPGVTWNKRARVWNAQARIGGKHVHIGTYRSEEDAYAAYVARVTPLESKIKETKIHDEKHNEQFGGG